MPTSAVNALNPDEFLTPNEVARITKLSPSTLKDKRWKGTGPAYIKLSPGRGGRVRYLRSSVIAWTNGSQNAGAA